MVAACNKAETGVGYDLLFFNRSMDYIIIYLYVSHLVSEDPPIWFPVDCPLLHSISLLL